MVVSEWYGMDLVNLLKRSNSELYRLYSPYMSNDTIRRTANKYRKLHKQGRVKMPKEEYPYDPEKEPGRISERRARRVGKAAAKDVKRVMIEVPEENVGHHQKLEEALAEGAVSKAIFTSGTHEGFIKNADNEIEYTKPMEANRIKFQVEFENEPKWPPVNRVESVKLPKKEQSEKDRLRTSKKAVILSDLQIPFQSPEAVDVALQIIQDVKPDKIGLVGDMLDLSGWSKYLQRPEWATQTQEAIQQAHQLLATLRKLAPAAEIFVLEGNHSARMEKQVLTNAMAAYGLKRADQPGGWPVLSVPYLCAFDTLDIEWLPGYPANRKWINQNLQVRHGHLVRSKGNTAVSVAQEERVSTIFGHIHRLETQYLTHHTYDGGKTIAAWSIGCLCRIDGSVPSTRNGYDLNGNPIKNYENWQNAIAVVDYEEGDGMFNVQPIYINSFQNHRAIYNGRTYEPRS